MTRLSNVSPDDSALQAADRSRIIARYRAVRATNIQLNQLLVNRLSKDVVDEGADRLRMKQNGVIVLDSEDEMAVLMDYCIHDIRRNGCNAVEQYLIDSPPDPDSDEMECLRAKQHAIYSLFNVEKTQPGFGVIVRDLFSNETIQVVDIGLSSSAVPGAFLVSRLMTYADFSMTNGATLPIGIVPAGDQTEIISKLVASIPRTADGELDFAPLIRSILKNDHMDNVRYRDPEESLAGRPSNSRRSRSGKIGRNSPCPCGSGNKYKRCCIRK